MASILAGVDQQHEVCPPPPEGPSDGLGGKAIGVAETSGPRYMYYRLYTQNGLIMSNNPIYANNPFISRTLTKSVAPPRTALSVKRHLCKIEGLPSAPTSSTLFESLSSETALAESSRLAFGGYSGPGLNVDDPIVLLVGVKDTEKRLASTVQSENLLPEAVLPKPRYVYYRLYDEDGSLASKMSFDAEDSSLGRIDTHSITPPQTVFSMRSQIMRVEGLVNRNTYVSEPVPYPME